jgi:hypothetical protein
MCRESSVATTPLGLVVGYPELEALTQNVERGPARTDLPAPAP